MNLNENAKVTDGFSLDVNKSINEFLSMDVNMKIELFDGEGTLKQRELTHNTMTTAGKNGIASQIASTPALPKAAWMELGTGTGGTTLLNAYIVASRTAVTSYIAAGAITTYICTFGAGVGTGAVTEAGLFDVVTQNTINMWTYGSFAVVNKLAADSIVLTWTITIS